MSCPLPSLFLSLSPRRRYMDGACGIGSPPGQLPTGQVGTHTRTMDHVAKYGYNPVPRPEMAIGAPRLTRSTLVGGPLLELFVPLSWILAVVEQKAPGRLGSLVGLPPAIRSTSGCRAHGQCTDHIVRTARGGAAERRDGRAGGRADTPRGEREDEGGGVSARAEHD